MAIAIVKSLNNDSLELKDPIPIYGQVRLWVDGATPYPTNVWVVIGDFKVKDYAELTTASVKDLTAINTNITTILEKAGLVIEDFSLLKKRSFHMDIRVPKELVDGYTR